MSAQPETIQTTHLIIHGRVQGVFFRDSMQQEAQRLCVNGWVRNRNDGTVEAMVQGDVTAVNHLVQWAHRGPAQARVDKVDRQTGSGSFHNFEILF